MNNQQGDFQTAQTLETFGFLPKMSQDEIYAQISYIIAQGWTPLPFQRRCWQASKSRRTGWICKRPGIGVSGRGFVSP